MECQANCANALGNAGDLETEETRTFRLNPYDRRLP